MNGDEGVGLLNTRVRCVCSDHNPREPMLQCEGAFCGVWQHAGCVKQQLLHSQLQPLPVGSDKWPKRRQFFCERCRVARADPFWEVYDALVMPPQQGRPTTGRLQVIDLTQGSGRGFVFRWCMGCWGGSSSVDIAPPFCLHLILVAVV